MSWSSVGGRRHQGPQGGDPVAPDVQQPGAVGGEQPLVETGGEVVATQLVESSKSRWAKEWAPSTMTCTPRSRAIRDTSRTGRIWPVMLTTWHMRITRVRGVIARSNSDTTSAGSSAGIGILTWTSRIPLPPLPLAEGVEHAWVVLSGGEDLVVGLKVEPELDGLQPLGGVAGEGDLLAVAAEGRRQPGPHRLPLRLQDLPHGVGGGLVGEVEVALHRLLDEERRRAHPAVVEVDQAAVDGEGLPDLEPEVLVRADRLWRLVGAGAAAGLLEGVSGAIEGERGPGGGPDDPQKITACVHGRPPSRLETPDRTTRRRAAVGACGGVAPRPSGWPVTLSP